MKKRYAVICILINLIGAAMIPANLFLVKMPEYVTVLAAVLMGAALLLFYLKSCGKILSKILLSIFTTVFAGFTLFGAYCNPYWNSFLFKDMADSSSINQNLSYEQAKEDMDYMMHYLEKVHPKFMNGVPDEVQEAYSKADEELRSDDQITVNSLNCIIQNVLSVLHDAHTTSFANYPEYHYLKYFYGRNQSGYNLTAVNEIDLQDLLEQKSDLYCYEVQSWGMELLRRDLSTSEGLRFLGLDLDNGISYTYTAEDGKTDTVIYHESDFVTLKEYREYNHVKEPEDEPFVSYTIDSEKSLAILTLKECNFNDEYRSSLKEMFSEIKAKGIRNVAVDIRDNGGGNSLVVDEFIKYLNVDSYRTDTSEMRLGFFNLHTGDGIVQNKKYSDLTFTGDLYLLTSAETFSSGMIFAEYVKDNALGTILGEAPGNTPSGYGDIATFMLPNSGLYFQVSTKQLHRADQDTEDILIVPDIECDPDNAERILYDTLN